MAGTRGEGSVESRHFGVSSNKYVNLSCVGSTYGLSVWFLKGHRHSVDSNCDFWLDFIRSSPNSQFHIITMIAPGFYNFILSFSKRVLESTNDSLF